MLDHSRILDRLCANEYSNKPTANGGPHVQFIRRDDPRRHRYERDLDAAGVPIPVAHRLDWLNTIDGGPSVFAAAVDESDRCVGGFEVRVTPMRPLPGHYFLGIQRFGGCPDTTIAGALIDAVATTVQMEPAIVRARISIFDFDEHRRHRLEEIAIGAGFTEAEEREAYRRTLVADLNHTEKELFDSLSRSARRNVRRGQSPPYGVRTIVDPTEAERVAYLSDQAMSRTGGHPLDVDWGRQIRFSAEYPTLSQMVGIYRTDETGEETLLAFAQGRNHGHSVEYSAAGSERPDEMWVPLGYAPLWDLIVWAKQIGAPCFDFGGITSDDPDDDPALLGISKFKRFFASTMVEVRSELTMRVDGVRARLGNAINAASQRAKKILRSR